MHGRSSDSVIQVDKYQEDKSCGMVSWDLLDEEFSP